jgi:hypothetical protein
MGEIKGGENKEQTGRKSKYTRKMKKKRRNKCIEEKRGGKTPDK